MRPAVCCGRFGLAQAPLRPSLCGQASVAKPLWPSLCSQASVANAPLARRRRACTLLAAECLQSQGVFLVHFTSTIRSTYRTCELKTTHTLQPRLPAAFVATALLQGLCAPGWRVASDAHAPAPLPRTSAHLPHRGTCPQSGRFKTSMQKPPAAGPHHSAPAPVCWRAATWGAAALAPRAGACAPFSAPLSRLTRTMP
jgi:hypothetical protein